MRKSKLKLRRGVQGSDTTDYCSQNKTVKKKRVRKLQTNWTTQQIHKLIHEAKIREGTWNPMCNEYKERKSRETLWQEVADTLGLPRPEVATKWNSLRCSFRAICKKLEHTNDDATAVNNPLYAALKFIEPTLHIETPLKSDLIHVQKRQRISPIAPSFEEDDSEVDDPKPVMSAKASAKRIRIEKEDDDYTNMGQRTLDTMSTAGKHDIWLDVGNFVASNGREWAAENYQLAEHFKTDIYELVFKYQRRFAQ